MGHGIWPEFLSDFHDTVITGNTIYGSNGHGIFLPNNFDCTISGNVIMDNRRAALGLYIDADPNQGHIITDNTLVSTEPTRRIDRPENLSHWWLPPYAEPIPVALEYDAPANYGSMSRTTFVAPTSLAGVIRKEPAGTLFSTLGEWTADAAWASAAGSLINRNNAILLFNDTEEPATMPVPAGSWTLPDGSAVGATIIAATIPQRGARHRNCGLPVTAVPRGIRNQLAGGQPGRELSRRRQFDLRDGFESGDLLAWSATKP